MPWKKTCLGKIGISPKFDDNKVKNVFEKFDTLHCIHFCCLFVFFYFISASRHIYSSLIPADYGNESDDDGENENSDSNKTETENAATNSVQPNEENIKIETQEKNEMPSETVSVAPAVDNGNDQLEFNPSPQTPEPTIDVLYIPSEVATTTTTTTTIAPPAVDSCDVNNGGCDQICNMVPDDETGVDVSECSCNGGFYLDQEGKKCLGELIILT